MSPGGTMGWAEGATFSAMAARRETSLAQNILSWIINPMSAQEIIKEFKKLPPAERARVASFVVENDDSLAGKHSRNGTAFALVKDLCG